LSQREVGQLDAELSALVRRLRIQNDREHWTVPGSGAAGGLGYGILAFLHGRLESGFSVVAEHLAIRTKIARASVLITGEGTLDSQSLHGKGPIGIAKLARELRRPVWAIAGIIEDNEQVEEHFDRLVSIVGRDISVEQALSKPKEALSKATKSLFRRRG